MRCSHSKRSWDSAGPLSLWHLAKTEKKFTLILQLINVSQEKYYIFPTSDTCWTKIIKPNRKWADVTSILIWQIISWWGLFFFFSKDMSSSIRRPVNNTFIWNLMLSKMSFLNETFGLSIIYGEQGNHKWINCNAISTEERFRMLQNEPIPRN